MLAAVSAKPATTTALPNFAAGVGMGVALAAAKPTAVGTVAAAALAASAPPPSTTHHQPLGPAGCAAISLQSARRSTSPSAARCALAATALALAASALAARPLRYHRLWRRLLLLRGHLRRGGGPLLQPRHRVGPE